MDEEIRRPAFHFLGYNIQKVDFERVGNEEVEEIRIGIANADYNEDDRIYSLVLTLQIDFSKSKKSTVNILGGFKINDTGIIKNKDSINSIFAASLYPYLRTVLHNLTSDDRRSIMLPTIDLRNINLEKGMSIKPKRSKEN